MPALGTEPALQNFTGDYPDWDSCRYISVNIPFPSTGDVIGIQTIDLTWDYPVEEEVVAGQGIPSLADWAGSAWRLRRIVGKLFCSAVDLQGQGVKEILKVAAGFIVLRVNEDDGTPIKNPIEYDPGSVGGIRDPWIWRRTWMLQTGGTGQEADIGWLSQAPVTNMEYGSVADGPHIDQKTNRIVSLEERLFLVISARRTQEVIDHQCAVDAVLDYRLLGSRMNATNRRNASR